MAFLFISPQVFSQMADVPFHHESNFIDFGVHNGNDISPQFIGPDGELLLHEVNNAWTIAFLSSDYIVIEDHASSADKAPWIQLKFDNVNLGENSYMTITSDFDQDVQYFNSESIVTWMNYSAFFKGDAVTIKLYVAPGDNNVSLQLEEMIVGDWVDGIVSPLSTICGADDRLTSSYQHTEGRLMPLGCTGWNTAAGYYCTAGHCLNVSSTSLQIMEFYVPASTSSGTTQPAAVNDQYPVTYSSRVFQEAGTGDDWGIYNCGANSNTGLTPLEAQRTFYHLTRADNPSSVFIRGFGIDEDPPGSGGGRNSDSQTCQYDPSPGVCIGETVNSSSDIYWQYQTDTEGGNSGSAILSQSSGVVFHSLGIHTHGGCTSSSTGYNKGTSFEADDTEQAMDTYWQTQVEYVDIDHHLSATTGTSCYPHYSIQNALNQANAGHGPSVSALELILIAGSNHGSGGVYAQTLSYSGATNGVVLRRTAGAVKIGPNATKSSQAVIENNGE
jgi:hypothetical protein